MFGQSKDPAEVEAERARQQAGLQAMIDAAGAMVQWVEPYAGGGLGGTPNAGIRPRGRRTEPQRRRGFIRAFQVAGLPATTP